MKLKFLTINILLLINCFFSIKIRMITRSQTMPSTNEQSKKSNNCLKVSESKSSIKEKSWFCIGNDIFYCQSVNIIFNKMLKIVQMMKEIDDREEIFVFNEIENIFKYIQNDNYCNDKSFNGKKSNDKNLDEINLDVDSCNDKTSNKNKNCVDSCIDIISDENKNCVDSCIDIISDENKNCVDSCIEISLEQKTFDENNFDKISSIDKSKIGSKILKIHNDKLNIKRYNVRETDKNSNTNFKNNKLCNNKKIKNLKNNLKLNCIDTICNKNDDFDFLCTKNIKTLFFEEIIKRFNYNNDILTIYNFNNIINNDGIFDIITLYKQIDQGNFDNICISRHESANMLYEMSKRGFKNGFEVIKCKKRSNSKIEKEYVVVIAVEYLINLIGHLIKELNYKILSMFWCFYNL